MILECALRARVSMNPICTIFNHKSSVLSNDADLTVPVSDYTRVSPTVVVYDIIYQFFKLISM